MLERELAPAENEEAYDCDDFFKGNETLQRALATLRRYCVHSTLVPVVVPIFFPRTMGKSI